MVEAGKESGFFGLFKKKEKETGPPIVTGAVGEGDLANPSEIAHLLVLVLEGKYPVRIFLANSSGCYYTHLEWEFIEYEEGEVLQSKEYLEEGDYLLLAPLDPPIGNIKIRNAAEIRAEFASERHLLECVTTLQTTTPDRKICLAFPKTLRVKPQKRAAVRVPVDRKMRVTASVVRPSGIVFSATFVDVSVTGAAFSPTGATPRIADHSRVELLIDYPEGKCSVEAVVLGSFIKTGETVFRAQFLISSHKISGEVSAFVSYVQRELLQRRALLME